MVIEPVECQERKPGLLESYNIQRQPEKDVQGGVKVHSLCEKLCFCHLVLHIVRINDPRLLMSW